MFESLRRSRNRKAADEADSAASCDTATDTELHSQAQRGDTDAMATLYHRHGALIYRFSLRMCQDPSVAEEVTQEVFLALMRQGERYDPERGKLATWLCGVARRQVWKQLEKQQRYHPLTGVDDIWQPESPDDTPAVALTRKEAVEALRRGVDELPAQWKEVILLCEFEEMTYAEVALVIGVPVGTVRSRLSRAKVRLKTILTMEPQGAMKEQA
jgi:RNA polymerase sigma-70 factor, ECF subfamily